ncbi:MAG: hypothetical protein ACI39W_06775 [Brotaphodocola sp.]
MKNRMKRKLLSIVMITMLISGIVPLKAEAAPHYLRAVTYVSDAWVINFWNTESDHMDEELEQIAADGFNSIVLVIPWREFQPTVNPVSYNDYAFEKLERVMCAAQRHGLWVSLRISYTWDYYTKEDSKNRFRELLKDGKTRQAWIDYVGRLYDFCSGYSCFYGGFMTWEDFWNYVEDVPRESKETRLKEAKQIGYQDYLKENYDLDQLSEYYQSTKKLTDYDDIYIPSKTSPAYRLFYDYYDDMLMELLQDAQEVFPNLSMEVRLDVDPVNGIDGGLVGAHHFRTFPCKNASYTSLMYSVSMGQENKGERIDADQAVAEMQRQLQRVRAYNGDKPIFIDQLLYMDGTEEFSYNAQLYENEREPYLAALPPLLKRFTNGYAIWSYRSYTNNAVYNCQFALGSRGWETNRARVCQMDGSSQMYLEDGGSISQQIGHRINGKRTHDNIVRFTAKSSRPVTVSVTLGQQTKEVLVMGEGQYELNFDRLEYDMVTFRARGEVYLDNIDIYNFVQDGQLYDIDGNELSCLPAMRNLNAAMSELE